MISTETFGILPNGEEVSLYVIRREDGTSASFCNYGARVVSLCVPDRSGSIGDITWGYDSISGYLSHENCAGAVIGRYASRIENSIVALNGKSYNLTQNEYPHLLHGGKEGFQNKIWSAYVMEPESIMFSYVSQDGEEGFPGRLIVNVIYKFNGKELTIEYFAQSDKDTYCNMTNHAFFNLSGRGDSDIYDHRLKVCADNFCKNYPDIPMACGEILSVLGTPMDFTSFRAIGSQINSEHPQLHSERYGKGYNHTFVLNKRERNSMELAAALYEPSSGRRMDVYTTLPGLQLFSANRTSSHPGKNGVTYSCHGAICFETTFFANSSRCPWFPSPVLRKGAAFNHITMFHFSSE